MQKSNKYNHNIYLIFKYATLWQTLQYSRMYIVNNMLNASGITARAAQLFPSNVLQEMYMSLDSDSEFQHAGVIFEYEKNRIGKLSVNPGSLILSPSSHYDKKH